jgi:hypothetical protein
MKEKEIKLRKVIPPFLFKILEFKSSRLISWGFTIHIENLKSSLNWYSSGDQIHILEDFPWNL